MGRGREDGEPEGREARGPSWRGRIKGGSEGGGEGLLYRTGGVGGGGGTVR
jgi:hypothetical protein